VNLWRNALALLLDIEYRQFQSSNHPSIPSVITPDPILPSCQ
jgi:hypothetical protein